MTLVRNINGKNEVIANKSVIDHSQLSNREAYGCHPISAIRKLPEKLNALKEKDIELEEQINSIKTTGQPDEMARAAILSLQQDVRDINTKASGIQLTENEGELTFTNYNGESSSFRSGNEVDNDTIQLVDDKIALKKVYTSTDLNGDGTKSNPISIVNKPDEETLKTIDNKFVVEGLKTSDGILTAENIKTADTGLQNQIDSINNSLIDIDSLNSTQDAKLYDLESRTKGMGGYLNTYNFGKNVTQDALTQYAMTDIGVSDPIQIFNGTKVINSYNKHTWVLTNTPDSIPAVFSWEDLGETQQIQYATNKTAGLVKSSTNELEGEIDTLGHISINGLEEKFTDIETNYVKNTDIATSSKAGVVKAQTSNSVNRGIYVSSEGFLSLKIATDNEISTKANTYNVISPQNLDLAVKTGLTTNTIELTDEEKTTAQNWLGIDAHTIIKIEGTQDSPVNFKDLETGKFYLLSGYFYSNSYTTRRIPSVDTYDNKYMLLVKISSTKILIYNWAIGFDINGAGYTIPTESANSILSISPTTGQLSSSKIVPINFNINSGDIDTLNLTNIYAPTVSGSSGQFLQSNGSAKRPTWVDLTIPTKTSDLTNDSNFYVLGEDLTAGSITTTGNVNVGNHIYLGNTKSIYATLNNGNKVPIMNVSSSNNMTYGAEGIGYIAFYNTIQPSSMNSGVIDIGSSISNWRDIYLSRNLTDGTNKISVSELTTMKSDLSKIKDLEGIAYVTYDNTTFSEHLDEILGYVNAENGGPLICLGFKTSTTNAVGDITEITTDTTTNTTTIDTLSSQVVLGATTYHCAYPQQFVSTTSDTQDTHKGVYFNCKNALINGSGTLFIDHRDDDTPTVTVSGNVDYVSGTNYVKQLFRDVSILDLPLEHLIITYHT